MTTLLDLRELVRAQTQTQAGELGDALIDWYLQQAYERTINAEVQWPFFQNTWPIGMVHGSYQMDVPGDCNPPGIMTLFDADRGVRMQMINQQEAEDYFSERPEWNGTEWANTDVPLTAQAWYSVWADMITIWPINVSSEDRQFVLRGYRKPLVWLVPDTQEPDCDPRLHLCLVHYAVALAYEQQEDETLNATYMDRWSRDVEMARSQIMQVRHHRPLVGAGSISPTNTGFRPFVVEPPPP